MCVCAGQSQDGKVVSSGSGCELSELMKRRLESVASTGSSASSGFIEDKSYCDSEEEEEGKGQARLASLQPPHPFHPLFVPPAVPLLPSPLLHPSCPGTKAPHRLFSIWSLMGRFLLLFSSTITAAGATVTPLRLGRRLFISCPDLRVAPLCGSSLDTARQPCCS